MTKIELIEFLGDFITKLDMVIASMLPSDPSRTPLEAARGELDSKLLVLRKIHFDANSQKYLSATEQLEAINKDLKKTIDDVDKMVETLELITRFVATVDKIIQIVVP